MTKTSHNKFVFLFVFLLFTVYFILDFQHILFFQPQGIHYIRQTDSLSFAANYFHNGFRFFEPQVFNLNSTDGKAACEFPILYYCTALLYMLFGEKEFILRLLTLGISTLGFVYLFRMLQLILKDNLYAFAFSFLFLSSTVLLYYSINFLPDAAALGFTFIGWYYFFRFQHERKAKQVYSFFACFLFASLLKATYFINPMAALLSLLLIDYKANAGIKQLWGQHKISLISFSVTALLVLLWNVFVHQYNEVNHDHYFLTQTRPIWKLTGAERFDVWDHISRYWYSKYYYQTTFHVFLILLVLGLIFIRKSEKSVFVPALFLSLGSICFFLLFFAQFQDHDYYFITLIPGIILLITSSFITLKNKFPVLIRHWSIRLLFVIISLLSLNYGREKLAQRFKETPKEQLRNTAAWSKTRIQLDKMRISNQAKLIVVGDATPNASLYFLNRKGWTVDAKANNTKAQIEQYIDLGADYILFTNDNRTDFKPPSEALSRKNGMLIYRLK